MAVDLVAGAEPLPGYRLLEHLGGGGCGQVWKSTSAGGVQVALKFVALHSRAGELEHRAIKLISDIRHPNLLSVHGYWLIDDYLVISMELADGTLMHRYNEAVTAGTPGIPFDELAEYFREAAKGVDHLNSFRHPHPEDEGKLVSLQHRDIKPENLLVVGGGVKVGDWGLLRVLEGTRTSHTGPMTLAYAAPEFFEGQTCSRSDQYSLAVTYYRLRTGRFPFAPKTRARRPDLSPLPDPRERQALERALAYDPDQRWPSCRDFVAALQTTRPDFAVVPDDAIGPGARTLVENDDTVLLPQFHYGGVVPPEYFINRERELREAEEVVHAGQSFLIVGHRRVGKTSFCKKLLHQVMGRSDARVLASYLNVQHFPSLTIETFLEHTLLNLIGEVARHSFGCKYHDLMRADPAEGRPELRGDGAFVSFVNLFRQVSLRTHSQDGVAPPPLRLQEFVRFTHETLEIVRACGWRHVVVFYDEANRLPRDLSVELVSSNEEALNSAGVISVYVVSPRMLQAFPVLRETFGREVHLGPFCRVEDLRRLLARYYFEDAGRYDHLPVSSEAIDALWQLSGGEPYLIQLLAGRCFGAAREEHARKVGDGHVRGAYAALLAEGRLAFVEERRADGV